MFGDPRRFVEAFCLPFVLLLAGCAFGATGTSAVSNAAPSVQRIGSRTAPIRTIVVANAFDTVTAYSVFANGNVVPIRTIAGAKTGLDVPFDLAQDRGGRLYVTNARSASPSITVYPAGANGDVAPIQTIAGSETGLSVPKGIAIQRDREIYVVDGYGDRSRIAIFAAGSNGNVPPLRTISGPHTGLDHPEGIAIDTNGYIYVTNRPRNDNSVKVYPPGASGDTAPVRTVRGPHTRLENFVHGIGLDTAGRIYVAISTVSVAKGEVLVFATGANGDVAPVQEISGSKTELNTSEGLAVLNGRLYVGNYYADSITVYPTGASGDSPPIQTIAGSNTGLQRPSGVIVP